MICRREYIKNLCPMGMLSQGSSYRANQNSSRWFGVPLPSSCIRIWSHHVLYLPFHYWLYSHHTTILHVCICHIQCLYICSLTASQANETILFSVNWRRLTLLLYARGVNHFACPRHMKPSCLKINDIQAVVHTNAIHPSRRIQVKWLLKYYRIHDTAITWKRK